MKPSSELSKIGLILFLLITIIHMIGIVMANTTISFISKPLLMPTLLIYFFGEVKLAKKNVITPILIVSLIFSLGGDFALMFKSDIYFILGLGSFLIAHILYIVAFNKINQQTSGAGLIKAKPILILPFLLYGILLYTLLFSKLDIVLKIAVPIYASAISLMAIFTLNLYPKLKIEAFKPLFLGAVLFIISDSCIAINRFFVEIPQATLVIMVTYILAQWLIIQGCIRYLKHT